MTLTVKEIIAADQKKLINTECGQKYKLCNAKPLGTHTELSNAF